MSSFTDKLVNRLTPDQQISSILNYQDTVSEAVKAVVAENLGLPMSGINGTNGTDGTTLNDFQDATFGAFVMGHVQRWIRITGSSNGNDGFYHIDDFTGVNEVVISPALPAAETGLVWQSTIAQVAPGTYDFDDFYTVETVVSHDTNDDGAFDVTDKVVGKYYALLADRSP